MWEEDAGVVTARWESEAGIEAIAARRGDVGTFARAHGMSTGTREDVAAAVSEAVADAVVRVRRSHEPGLVTVAAATDGVWLSVHVTDAAPLRGREPLDGLPLVACLPNRLEWAADARGTSVLMEFAMASDMPVVSSVAEHDAAGRRCRPAGRRGPLVAPVRQRR